MTPQRFATSRVRRRPASRPMWCARSTAPRPSWRATATAGPNIPLDDEYDEVHDLCKWNGYADGLSALYTRIIVGASGRNPDGSPVAPRLEAREADYDSNFVFPPVLCPVASTPPIPDAFRSLDGSSTEAVYSAVPAAAGCDFVTLSVDTDPDRGHYVYFDLATDRCGDLDVDSVELYLWKRVGTGPYYAWSRERVYPWVSNGNEGYCVLRGGADLSKPNSYTQVVLAGRAVTDSGGPIVSMILAVTE